MAKHAITIPKTPKAALYIRVSTDMQADKDSLPLQESDLRKLADLNGIKDIEVFRDVGFSGKNLNRPAFRSMMERIRAREFSHLYVWKLDRISRNLLDFLELYDELKDYGVAFASKNESFDTQSPGGEAMLKILLIFAELERKTIAERVTAVMLGRANENKWNGGRVPFGYMPGPVTTDANGKKCKSWPVPDPIEAPVVRAIFELYLREKALKKVAAALNAAGYRSRKGTQWSDTTVRCILKNHFYKGEYVYNRQNSNAGRREDFYRSENDWVVVTGQHEAIVPEETWRKCNDMLSKNRSWLAPIGSLVSAQDKYIFGGLLECAACGYTLNSKDRTRGHDHTRSTYYYCNGRWKVPAVCAAEHPGYASDCVLLPRLLKLIARIIEACANAIKFTSAEQLVSYLLNNNLIPGATGIEEAQRIYMIVRAHVKHIYGVDQADQYNPNALLVEQSKKEKEKQERALSRLKRAYLFDDGDMSEAEYFEQKATIEGTIAKLDKQIKSLSGNDIGADEAYLAQLSKLIMIKKLQDTNSDFDYYKLAKAIGRKPIHDFLAEIISRIIMGEQNKIMKIIFKNGVSITFQYEK
nr:MAG TPA: integrase [Caudoviricetes sp.]